MKPLRLALAALLLAAAPALAHAQLVTTMVDADGDSLPCVTVGPLAPLAQEYCVHGTEKQGFLTRHDLGTSGLTVGVAGDADGVVTAVAPGSSAAAVGLAPGDALIFVQDHPVRRPAGDVAEQLAFGPRGAPVRLGVVRGGQALSLSLVRAASPEPPGAPHSPNILIGIHPMVNWRGEFVPCMGAGVLGPAAIAACQSHYGRDGFVRVSMLGATGLSFASPRPDAAVVAAIEPGSPAAAADVRPGDVVTEVDGHALTASRGKEAQRLLFGRAGDLRRLVVERDGREVTVSLVLAKPS